MFTLIGAIIALVISLICLIGHGTNELVMVEWGLLAFSAGVVLDYLVGHYPLNHP